MLPLYNDAASYVCRRNETARYVCSSIAAFAHCHTQEQLAQLGAARDANHLQRCSRLYVVCMARGVVRACAGAAGDAACKIRPAMLAAVVQRRKSTEQWAQLVLPPICNDAASYVLSCRHMKEQLVMLFL